MAVDKVAVGEQEPGRHGARRRCVRNSRRGIHVRREPRCSRPERGNALRRAGAGRSIASSSLGGEEGSPIPAYRAWVPPVALIGLLDQPFVDSEANISRRHAGVLPRGGRYWLAHPGDASTIKEDHVYPPPTLRMIAMCPGAARSSLCRSAALARTSAQDR